MRLALLLVQLVCIWCATGDSSNEKSEEIVPNPDEVDLRNLQEISSSASDEVEEIKRAFPMSGSLYGKRAVPFNGAIYGKRAVPFNGGLYGKRVPFNGALYGKRIRAVPMSGGLYG